MQFHIATAQPVRTVPGVLVTTDLRFDIPSIRAEAKRLYGQKLGFIAQYEGAPRRHWQLTLARQSIALAWRTAHLQRHELVLSRMPAKLPYTALEQDRIADLRAVMARCPISMRGNAAYRQAAGEFSAISNAARQRAYDAVLAETQGRAVQ